MIAVPVAEGGARTLSSIGWKISVLPGGQLPVRKTSGAASFDIYTRAIVGKKMDSKFPCMRETLFDFINLESPLNIPQGKKHITTDDGELAYILYPREVIRIGVGFVVELPPILAAYVEPRGSTAESGLEVLDADKPVKTLKVHNKSVPIDSDFRAEPCALLKNVGKEPFLIKRHQRLTQLTLKYVCIDEPIIDPKIVKSVAQMSKTTRGNGQNGSTGK